MVERDLLLCLQSTWLKIGSKLYCLHNNKTDEFEALKTHNKFYVNKKDKHSTDGSERGYVLLGLIFNLIEDFLLAEHNLVI